MSKSTPYPGVKAIGPGKYAIRVKARNVRTGRLTDTWRRVLAPSPSAAAAQRMELVRDAQDLRPTAERQRVRAYASSWLRTKLPELRASTRSLYASTLDLHILPTLGDYYVDEVVQADIVAWRDAQAGAPATVNQRLRVLKTVFAAAADELDLPRDPAARVRAIRAPKVDDDQDAKALTSAELAELLDAAGRVVPSWYPLILTLALTGMRWGEASALRWEDIDEASRAILVRRAHWRGHIDETKTSVRRRVPLPEVLADALREHRQRLLRRQAKGLEAGWVFPSRTGGLMQSSSLRKPLSKALEAAKLERHMSAHRFRHTLNNLLRQLSSGMVARSITGHTTEEMTEHYSHVALEERHVAVGGVVALLHRAPSTGGNSGGT